MHIFSIQGQEEIKGWKKGKRKKKKQETATIKNKNEIAHITILAYYLT